MDINECALGFDRAGERIAIAEEATCFRVMHARQGQPTVVQDQEGGGGALFVELSTTPSELRRRTGPGCFSLVQLDAEMAPISDAPKGYIELSLEKPAPEVATDGDSTVAQLVGALMKAQEENRSTLREVTGALTAIAKVNTEAMETLAKLASGQPIREVEVHPVLDVTPEQKDAVKQALETFGPLIGQLTPLLVAWAKKKVTDGEVPAAAQLVAGVAP